MRGFVPDVEVLTPANLQEALDLRSKYPYHRPLAGGTDLMVLFAAGRSKENRFLNLWGLSELKSIESTEDTLLLGALSTFSEIRNHPLIRTEFPNLYQSAVVTGALAIQNRGTLGGNLANASPAADTPPSLLAYGAEVELRSRSGSRWVPYDQFHLGYKQMDLLPDELLTRVRLPRPTNGAYHYYRKVGTRAAQSIAKLSLAAFVRTVEGRITEIRLGLGSVAPTPIRARKTEEALLEASLQSLPLDLALEALQEDIRPIDDIRSTAHYRRKVTGNVLLEMLNQLKRRGA